MAPNKQSVYGERLSGNEEAVETESSMTFRPRLRIRTRVRYCLICARSWRAAKAEHPDLPLYYKTDTHWNLLGGYYGYKAIMAVELAKTMPIANLQLTSP